jgi:MYXO-CTERM domain-containing protein
MLSHWRSALDEARPYHGGCGRRVAELLTTSVSDPAAWALVLAGIAGSGFLGRRRPKKSMEIED